VAVKLIMLFTKMLLVKLRYINLGHAVAQWLRHCATSRKVAGSRHDEINIFRFT
jgi:hypothetical protein